MWTPLPAPITRIRQRVQLSSPRCEITAVCFVFFSYLLAASSFCLHFFFLRKSAYEKPFTLETEGQNALNTGLTPADGA